MAKNQKIKTTLTTADIDNIAALSDKNGFTAATAIMRAIRLCHASVAHHHNGYKTAVRYDDTDGMAAAVIDLRDITVAVNAQNRTAAKTDYTLSLPPGTLTTLRHLRELIKAPDDGVAAGFALAFARHTADVMAALPGRKKQLLFFRDDWRTGIPAAFTFLNDTLGNRFKKACRRTIRKTARTLVMRKQM